MLAVRARAATPIRPGSGRVHPRVPPVIPPARSGRPRACGSASTPPATNTTCSEPASSSARCSSITAPQRSNIKTAVHALAGDRSTVWVPALNAEGERGSEIAETIIEIGKTKNERRRLRMIVRRQRTTAVSNSPRRPSTDGASTPSSPTRPHGSPRGHGRSHHRRRGGIPEDTIRQLKEDFGSSTPPWRIPAGNWLWWHACALAQTARWIATPPARRVPRCCGKRLRLRSSTSHPAPCPTPANSGSASPDHTDGATFIRPRIRALPVRPEPGQALHRPPKPNTRNQHEPIASTRPRNDHRPPRPGPAALARPRANQRPAGAISGQALNQRRAARRSIVSQRRCWWRDEVENPGDSSTRCEFRRHRFENASGRLVQQGSSTASTRRPLHLFPPKVACRLRR